MNEVIRQQRVTAEKVVIDELLANGIPCTSIFDFVNGSTPAGAAPVLVSLLDRVTDPMIFEGVVRALCIKQARGKAEEKLIELFRALPVDSYSVTKWAIGNTLSCLDGQRCSADLIRLALYQPA